ncbi:MAG: 1,4-beta-xylanase [Bacteroidota bacterium]
MNRDNINRILTSGLAVLLISYFNLCDAQNGKPEVQIAKFEPADGQYLFFAGQDMEAIGGLNDYNDGYFDHFEPAAGITLYTNFSPGSESFGYYNRGNDGIKSTASWGAGSSCAQCYVDDPDFEHSLISIGLSFVDHEKKVARGQHDKLIRELGSWIKGLGERPVFLRIGYEFDGWAWNHYQKKHYLAAWERIHSIFNEMGVTNVAFVWQSKGTGSDQSILEEWYPGDELVDWCAYSHFGNPDEEMLTFARKHHKPVFIAEATPVMQTDNLYFNADLSEPEVARRVWKSWFVPFLNTLNEHQDIIKAFSYINADWSSQPMWIINPVFQKVDSRIQESEFISKKWKEEMAKPQYLKLDAELWESLGVVEE